MGPHVSKVTSLCLQYMKHDPNYNYDSDGDEDQMETEDSEFSEQGGWPACHWGWSTEMAAALLGPPNSPAKDRGHILFLYPHPSCSSVSSPAFHNLGSPMFPSFLTAQ